MAILLVGGRASAQLPRTEVSVPPELQTWIPWVLEGHEDTHCLIISDHRQCHWPGELALDVERSGARFRLQVVVDAKSVVPLPGSTAHWPEQVRVGQRIAVTVTSAQGPAIELGPGSHVVTGELVWTSPPESLPIPKEIARVTVRRDGGEPSFPNRTRSDRLWLGPDEQAAAAEAERTEVEVFRRLRDGVPFFVDTRIVLRVSGRARAVDLGRVLLPGSRPLSITSSLPVALDEKGELVAQIWAGEHEIAISALLSRPPERIARPQRKPPWPKQEIWVWTPRPSVRLVRPSGLVGIDPERTHLPQDWRALSTYVAAPDSVLEIATLQRGQPTMPANEITLSRTIWIDEDGRGFTAQDDLTGTLHRGWRLNLEAGELGRVRFGDADRLITRSPDGYRGVELRDAKVELMAEWRSPDRAGGPLPAAGWSEQLQQSSVTVSLPPGWRYLGAWGVDHTRVPEAEQTGDWYLFYHWEMPRSDWGLLGYLFILLVAAAAGRVLGWPWGVVTLVVLGLSREYELAPFTGWAVLLAWVALLRRTRPGLQRAIVGTVATVSMLALASWAVFFVTLKLMTVMSPNDGIEHFLHNGLIRAFGAVGGETIDRPKTQDDYSGPLEQETVIQQYLDSAAQREAPDRESVPEPLQQQLEVDAVVQTGPGVPDRFGSSRTLSWDSPVDPDTTFRVFLLNRWQNALLGLAHAAAILALGFALLRALWRGCVGEGSTSPTNSSPPSPPEESPDTAGETSGNVGAPSDAAVQMLDLANTGGGPPSAPGEPLDVTWESAPADNPLDAVSPPLTAPEEAPSAGPGGDESNGPSTVTGRTTATLLQALLLLGALAGVLTVVRPARAEVPPPAVLTELEARLTRAAECDDSCLVVPTLRLAAHDHTLALDLEVHAQQAAALPLPGPASSWVPRTVTLDGTPSQALVLGEDGHLSLRLTEGRHHVILEGPIAGSELTMTLGTTVHRVAVEAEGWLVDGVQEGRCDGTLVLARQAKSNAGARNEAGETTARERITLPPWLEIERTIQAEVTWKVKTVVRRISKDGEPLAVRFPLLPGEEVTESTLTITGNTVLLSLRRDQDELTFWSVLRPAEELALIAARKQPWSEVWALECGTIWHCELSGIAPTEQVVAGRFRPRFRPWPGERIGVRFTRPPAAGGASTTIHTARLSLPNAPEPARLQLEVATSTGGTLPLMLPPGTEITRLVVDDSAEPVLSSDGTPRVVLKPGRHQVVAFFRTATPRGPFRRAPRVAVGAAVNATTSIAVPEERVVLFVGGSGDRHSVVMWWGLLGLLIVGGFALSFLPHSPLKRWQWVGLVVGFTQVHWMWLLPVVGWLVLVSWRDRWTGPARRWKNFVQLGIGAVTLCAAGALLKALYSVFVDVPHTFVQPDGDYAWVGSTMDRVLPDAALPEPWVLTAPFWAWRLLHLVWALWLALLLWKIGRFAWTAFTRDGIWGPWPRWLASTSGDAAPPTADTGSEPDALLAGNDDAGVP